MADQKHLDILKQGKGKWDSWRRELMGYLPHLGGADLRGFSLEGFDLEFADLKGANLSYARLHTTYLYEADLSEADLSEADLSFANLYRANLSKATLIKADLTGANLGGADLSGANLTELNLRGAKLDGNDLSGANLSGADLSGADLRSAKLTGANLSEANLSGVDLSHADLSRAVLVETNLTRATLTHCQIYGISAWDVQLEGATQNNLVVTPRFEPIIAVDQLEVAQFIYLLLNNPKIRDVIDTVAKKAVLILGRFTSERKVVLDSLRDALRQHGYLPILFDFEKPASRDLTETITTLAHLARFIIVDLTDPSSAPHEVATIIPHCIVPVQPLMLQDDAKPRHEYAMFEDLRQRYRWVLPTVRYQETARLFTSLKEQVIDPAEQKVKELAQQK